jgi:hydroxymethylglutaryl-CoA lyase
MSERVRITDVSPRDGLQNEPGMIPADEKARLVELLTRTGVDEVEVSSFVSARWVPQLGDAREVFEIVANRKPPGLLFSALVPNEKGIRALLRVNDEEGFKAIDKVAVFTAASDTFSKQNTNNSIADSIKLSEGVVKEAKKHDLLVRGYISCAIRCPFEGDIEPSKVAQVAQTLLVIGCDEIDLGDTIGAGEPATINALFNELLNRLGDRRIDQYTLHLHDTFGRAAECVREALQLGVRSFDGAAGGLGGCPYASTGGQRAPGNIDTATLVRTVEEAGYETGVDMESLAEAAAFAEKLRAEANAGDVV